MLNYQLLKTLGKENGKAYKEAQPFAHGVYDDVFDPDILRRIIDEFETVQDQWLEFESTYEKKLQMNQDEFLGATSRQFIHALNSAPFLEFLEDLTGIEGLIPDPYLFGAGYHQIEKGGKLGIHVDFNTHKKMHVFRRINVLVYLNEDWQEEWGGHFQLWSRDRKTCEKKVLPIFNRMAIFSTTRHSYHGHPEPLACPDDRKRRSIAMYYYTSEDMGDQEATHHTTIFVDEKGREEKSRKTFLDRFKSKIKTF